MQHQHPQIAMLQETSQPSAASEPPFMRAVPVFVAGEAALSMRRSMMVM
jgi:hypothetical protein